MEIEGIHFNTGAANVLLFSRRSGLSNCYPNYLLMDIMEICCIVYDIES